MQMRQRPAALLVEDNPIDHKLARILLEKAGFRVEHAFSAEEALPLIDGPPFSVVIVDVDLPGMSGFDLTRLVRARPARAGLPILAVSSTTGAEAQTWARAAGCDAFLPKPLDYGTFVATVARLARPAGADQPAA